MRAALLLELGQPLEIEDVELLAPGPRDVVVRPGATAGHRVPLVGEHVRRSR